MATFITLPKPNPAEQTLFFPSQSHLSPNHFSLIFLLSISHIIIMFLPNPNTAKQLIVFPSQSQIFRLPPTIFLFSFALSHIIFFPYPNPAEQTVVVPSQILNLRFLGSDLTFPYLRTQALSLTLKSQESRLISNSQSHSLTSHKERPSSQGLTKFLIPKRLR